MKQVHRGWAVFLFLALVAGILLRILYVNDMEYKEDEQYNFHQSQLIGNSIAWPWKGIASGVYLPNPGMSIWVFAALAKLFGIHHPTDLATAVQLFSIFGILLILPFAYYFLETIEEKVVWLWSCGLSLVNPFLVWIHRKLWPEAFLPFFSILILMGWWQRTTIGGAFVWGLVGALIGQIHMSGFFFAAALAIWTFFFDRRPLHKADLLWKPVCWSGWFAGSTIGALPLIPWALEVMRNPVGHSVLGDWKEMIQLRFWVFWLTDPIGISLGNPLGVSKGNSQWVQIADFLRYPLWNGEPTYLVGLAHGLAIGLWSVILGLGLLRLWRGRFDLEGSFIGRSSWTAFVQNATFWSCGFLLTLTGVSIRRYYLCVTFPLEFILLVRWANPLTIAGRRILISLWICELVISANFISYIHRNQGAPLGDYGPAYRVIKDKLPEHLR